MAASRVTFEIGGGFLCDLEVLLATRLLIYGSPNSGKSWLIRRILEQTFGRVQQLVLDLEGDFVSLRERFDYLLVAQGGDTPADPRTARRLAVLLREAGASAILDLHDLKPEARANFVREFLEGLIESPRALWDRPALVVIDEAHILCPQHRTSEVGKSVIDVATRGRKRGLCTVLATQRMAALSKDATAQQGNRLLGRTSQDVDALRAVAELGWQRTRQKELRELPPGDFFAVGPALCTEVTRVSVGPVQTTHEAHGRTATKPPPATAKIRELLARLSLPPTDQAEPPDEDGLQRLRQLEESIAALVLERDALLEDLVPLRLKLEAALQGLDAIVRRPGRDGADLVQAPAPMDRDQALREKLQRDRGRHSTPTTPPLSPLMQRILDALAELRGTPLQQAPRPLLALLVGLKPSTGSFGASLGALRTANLIDYPTAGRVELTPSGDAMAGDVPRMDAAELRRRVLRMLDGLQTRIVKTLLNVHPKALARDELATTVGISVTTGSFGAAVGALRSLGLLAYPQVGRVIATDVLFLRERATA